MAAMTVEELINTLRKECKNSTIEGELLKRKYIRELYKQVGEPKKEDFPEEYEIAGVCAWSKPRGYTTYIVALTEDWMKRENNAQTNWRITYPSQTKIAIEKRYREAGWSCEVQAYNVCCAKYVKHPKIDGLWVRFYCTRDCARYELIIEEK